MRKTLALLGLLFVGSCVATAPSPARQTVTVKVINNNWNQAVVYLAVEHGLSERLGEVNSNEDKVLLQRFNTNVSAVMVHVRMIGTDQIWDSEPIQIGTNETLVLRLQNLLSTSSIMVGR